MRKSTEIAEEGEKDDKLKKAKRKARNLNSEKRIKRKNPLRQKKENQSNKRKEK